LRPNSPRAGVAGLGAGSTTGFRPNKPAGFVALLVDADLLTLLPRRVGPLALAALAAFELLEP
jgi:hypothetical protein